MRPSPPSPHLQVKMELTLKPEALDNVDRKIVQLEMEAHSLKPKVWISVGLFGKGKGGTWPRNIVLLEIEAQSLKPKVWGSVKHDGKGECGKSDWAL